MNLFKSFKSANPVDTTMANNTELNGNQNGQSQMADDNPKILPEVPERIFIENEKPIAKTQAEPANEQEDQHDLQALYRYLERNLETKGYEHALINPDSSSMEEHILFINNELHLMISRVKTYYSGYLRKIDFHMETRKRNGMIETVEELITHKETILDELNIVKTIEADATNGTGACQNLIISYKKGFRNGMAAITYGTIFGKRN